MPLDEPLPPVAILCGGRGTRLQHGTESIPKPQVEIGGRPIVWHVVQIYAVQGFRDFVLLTGYRGELIERFVAAEAWPAGVTVRCLDTGVDTPTGGRLHRAHGRAATMTVVRPELQFGVTHLDGDGRVTGFEEKPRSEQWINGGFFCFEPAGLDYVAADSVLEREPLERLAADGGLRAYRHGGFWECMDTYKDAVQLNDLWDEGKAPWRSW